MDTVIIRETSPSGMRGHYRDETQDHLQWGMLFLVCVFCPHWTSQHYQKPWWLQACQGVREDFIDARSVFSGENTFLEHFSMALTSLTAENTEIICLWTFLSKMGTVVQVGRYVVHVWADGLQWDSLWSSYHLLSSQLPPCWAGREVCESWGSAYPMWQICLV